MYATGKNSGNSYLTPMQTAALMNQAMQCCQRGAFEDALPMLRRVLDLDPHHQEALFHLGSLLAQGGLLDEAQTRLKQLLVLNKKIPEAYNNLGNVHHALKQYDEALSCFNKAIKLAPDRADFHFNKGKVLKALHRQGEALLGFERAIALKPDFAEAHNSRGLMLRDLGRHEEADRCFDNLLRMFPTFAYAYNNKGIGFLERNRLPEARASFDAAIAIDAGYAEAHFNKAMGLLLEGRLREGFELFEWRWKFGALQEQARRFAQPLWLGDESLAGKTILLHAEQGLGDTFQFCRFARDVQALGARVVLELPHALMQVLAGLEGVDQFVAAGSALPEFDFHAPLMSLPLALKLSLEQMPPARAYLFADQDKQAAWARRLGPRQRLRVGLVWNGGFRADRPELWAVNARRNIPLELIATLQSLDADFYSLQKGEPAESEVSRKKAKLWPGGNFHNFAEDLADFSDTAALIANLDLVVAVDTSTAHLSAAMGRPTWILNRFDSCWRWLLERSDSPWYESVRIYRQGSDKDWKPVLAAVQADLAVLIDGTTPSMDAR